MRKVTIADSLFMPYGKAAHLLGDNLDVSPTNFEWELADPQSARFVTESHMREAKGAGQILWILEPFFLHPENYLWAMENGNRFDHVLSHNAYFSKQQNWLWHPFGGSMIRFSDWGVYPKPKNISMLLSQKNSQGGHQLRHHIVEQYADRFDDIFGLTPWDRKIDALAPYRYAVIIETERSPYYFSEKLIDCLSVGTIPIYWGCPDIGKFFERNAIIEFEDMDDLPGIFGRIDEEHYRSREVSIATNLTMAKQYAVCEDQIYQKYPFLFGENHET